MCAAGMVALPPPGLASPNVEMLPRLGPESTTPHLLSASEGMVEAGNVGHDGLLIGLWGVHDIWGWQRGVYWPNPGVGNRLKSPPRQSSPLEWEGTATSSHGRQLPATQNIFLFSESLSDHPRVQQSPPLWGEETRWEWVSEQTLQPS